MPLYDFRCLECEHEFEALSEWKPTKPVLCPECMGRVERLLSAPSFKVNGHNARNGYNK